VNPIKIFNGSATLYATSTLADFMKVAEMSEVPAGSMKLVKVGGEDVLLVNVDGKFYAITNICTHRGGPLNEGTLQGTTVTCPWHGGQFDVTNGNAVAPPPRTPEATYDIKLEGTSVLLKKK